MSLTEKEIVSKCQRGETEYYEQLVNKYKRSAYFYALGMVGSVEDALDLSQEAFIRAYRSIKRFKPQYQFKNWFFRILTNLCISHLRKKRRRRVEVSTEDKEGRTMPLPDDHFNPHLLLEQKEIMRQLWKALSELGNKHREIILLRDFQGLSYKQISEILEIPVGTVMSRLHQARSRLRVKMADFM